MATTDNSSNTNIYRYKFTPEIMTVLTQFAKIHQYDDRKTYKEAWAEWIKENKEILDEEQSRLHNLNYEGDVYDKMYKAARYYFRKKKNTKCEPKKRRNYISVSMTLIEAIDSHIARHSLLSEYTPAHGYNNFCELNRELLQEEITILKQNLVENSDIIDKIKKTYKNRYYLFSKNH